MKDKYLLTCPADGKDYAICRQIDQFSKKNKVLFLLSSKVEDT
jgi:hypothetical protein